MNTLAGSLRRIAIRIFVDELPLPHAVLINLNA